MGTIQGQWKSIGIVRSKKDRSKRRAETVPFLDFQEKQGRQHEQPKAASARNLVGSEPWEWYLDLLALDPGKKVLS